MKKVSRVHPLNPLSGEFRKVKTATHNFIMAQGRAVGNLTMKEPKNVRKGK